MAHNDDQSSKPETGKAAEDVLALARERFQRAVDAESENRSKQDDDIRFEAASPDDPWQWPETDRKARENAGRPCLTINKLPQHKKQVTNDIRQNRPSIKYRAADDKADPKTAEILTGLARHIEANSDADVAYDTAADHEVGHGLGYIRVLTDFVSDTSFDQDIYIKRVRDWRKVWLDRDAEDPAGADAEWAFIEEKIGETEFKEEYPNADPVDWNFLPTGDWFSASDKSIRVAEYYAFERKDATLLLWANGSTSFKGDKLPQGVFIGEMPIKQRTLKRKTLVWRKITGAQVLEKREYNWKYIPIARAIGNEALVDGKHIISGLVRNAKDAARMYNVAASAITERVMLAPKAPWVGPAEAFEGHAEWESANSQNHAYLPYNHVDTTGNVLPQPSRVQPATVEPGLQQVLLQAADDIKSTTGQYDASLGQRSNETSGKAIMARQREGDTATFHYVDNLARAVRHVARIILDMIPTVYDTRRVARILGEDSTEDFAVADPEMKQAYTELRGENGITKVFNPLVGVYDVVVTTGPGFTTRRMEAFDAMSQMTQANPALWQVIGDQLVRNMDWPGAEDMAERLKVTLLPQVQQMLGEQGEQTQIPPQVQMQIEQMGQQLQQLGQALENAAAEADKTRNEGAKLQLEGEKIEVERYRAETERMTALAPAVTPEQVQAIVMQTVREILTSSQQQAEQPPAPQMPAEMPMPMMLHEPIDALDFQPADMPQGMPAQQAFAPMEPQGF